MPTPQGGQWVAFPTFSQLDEAVFSMLVAGRMIEDDVAIMMVEVESTDNSWNLIKEPGVIVPAAAVVRDGLERAKVFVPTLCVAQQERADTAAKPVREFPLFLDHQPGAYEIVETAAAERLREVMSIAGKTEREERTEVLLGEITEELGGEGKQLEG